MRPISTAPQPLFSPTQAWRVKARPGPGMVPQARVRRHAGLQHELGAQAAAQVLAAAKADARCRAAPVLQPLRRVAPDLALLMWTSTMPNISTLLWAHADVPRPPCRRRPANACASRTCLLGSAPDALPVACLLLSRATGDALCQAIDKWRYMGTGLTRGLRHRERTMRSKPAPVADPSALIRRALGLCRMLRNWPPEVLDELTALSRPGPLRAPPAVCAPPTPSGARCWWWLRAVWKWAAWTPRARASCCPCTARATSSAWRGCWSTRNSSTTTTRTSPPCWWRSPASPSWPCSMPIRRCGRTSACWCWRACTS